MGVGAALFTAQSMQFGVALPALLAGLLLFNFWFTVNRLRSSARIIAYIHVVLEGGTVWRGWETSLRAYRIWTKYYPNKDPKFIKLNSRKTKKAMKKKARVALEQFVEKELDQKAVPDALMFYPPIYQIHIAFVVLCLITGFILIINDPNTINIVSAVVLVLLVGIFARYCWKFRPGKMRSLIERSVVIWNYALGIKVQKHEDTVRS